MFASDIAAPLYEVVFEDSLMELMEDVGGNAREDIRVWEIGPERCVNFTEAFILEL